MTSTNSLNNNRFFPMFKTVFKRYSAIFIIIQILTTVFSVIISKIGTDYITETIELWAAAGTKHDITDSFVAAFMGCTLGAGILGMFIIAFLLCRELYSKRASTFWFSMPVKRGAFFNANMLFGLCTLLTAFVIMIATVFISVTTSVGYQKGVLLFDMACFLQYLTTACLCVAVLFAIFMLCAVLSGRMWHYPVLCYIAVVSVNIGIIGLTNYLDKIWGFYVERSPGWIVSPIAAIGSMYYSDSVDVMRVIVLLLQFAVVYAAGYLVFKYRKAEVAETSLSGKIVPAIMITIALIATSFSGLSIGNITFMDVTVTDFSVFATFCIAAVATVIVTMILTAIFYRKAFTKITAKCLAVTMALTLIVVVAVELVPNGYVNYVPDADKVESVTLDENNDYYYYNGLTTDLFSFFGLDDYIYHGDYPVYSFSSDEAKAKVEALHKKMVDENTIKNYGTPDFEYHRYYSVKLTYKLKSGRTVTRAYCVGTMDIFDEYIALMQTEEAIRQNPALSYSNEDILFISVYDNRASYDEYDEYDEYGEYDTYDEYDYYEPAYYELNEYKALDDYSTLIDNIVKDKMAEPRNVFYSLITYNTSSFYIYDYDNIRYSDDNWEHYPEYNDIEIMFYTFSEDATDAQKKLMATMTPEEIIEYDYNCMYGDHYIPSPLTSEFIEINVEADSNTYAYLQSLGLVE